jgi:hypothetical protein
MSNNDETYSIETNTTHSYNNIEYQKPKNETLNHYGKLLGLLNKTIDLVNKPVNNKPVNNKPVNNAYLELLKAHFQTETIQNTTFTNVYGNTIYFLIDPLLNDIDDIIAFLYFFYLTISHIKSFPESETINIIIMLEKIDSNFSKIDDVTQAIISSCKNTLVKLEIATKIIISKSENASNKPVTKSEIRPDKEDMLISVEGTVIPTGLTKFTTKLPSKKSNPSEATKPVLLQVSITIFILRGILYDTPALIQMIKGFKTAGKINIIANGADIFSHEDGSCPSNVRCGTKIKLSSHISRKDVFHNYTEFIKEMKDIPNVHFNCFPLKRVDRPFTVQFIENTEYPIIASTNGDIESKDIVSALQEIKNSLSEITTYEFNGKPYTLAELCFPNITDPIVKSCEAYKQYGSFLIDMITVMSNPSNITTHTRTLIHFEETINMDKFKTLKDIDDYNETELTIKLAKDTTLIKRLCDHSIEALRTCYNWDPHSNKNIKEDAVFEDELKKNKLKLYSKFLSKTPGTLESSQNKGKTINLINPIVAILSKTIRNPATFTICDKPESPNFCIINDRNSIYTGGSSGPNGVLFDCDSKTYGRYRMNTFYKNGDMTFKLIKDYIEFRNENKFKIFNKLFLQKLDSQLNEHKEENKEYDNTLLFLKKFYKWFIENNGTNNEILDKIGIEIKTRCQTWLRQIPNYDYGKDGVTLCAHNTIPVPHFQTVFRIKDNDLFLSNITKYIDSDDYKILFLKPITNVSENTNTKMTVESFVDGYKKLMYFFTRGMRDGYGTTYPIQITTADGLYYTEPDDIYNGNAFIDVDDFYNNYVSPGKVDTSQTLLQLVRERKQNVSAADRANAAARDNASRASAGKVTRVALRRKKEGLNKTNTVAIHNFPTHNDSRKAAANNASRSPAANNASRSPAVNNASRSPAANNASRSPAANNASRKAVNPPASRFARFRNGISRRVGNAKAGISNRFRRISNRFRNATRRRPINRGSP